MVPSLTPYDLSFPPKRGFHKPPTYANGHISATGDPIHFGGSEVCLPDSTTASQLCRRFHQYALCVCRCPDACRLFWTSPATCWCCSSSNLCSELCYKLPSVATSTFMQIFDQSFVSFTEQRKKFPRLLYYSVKIRVIFGVRFERRNVYKKSKPELSSYIVLKLGRFWDTFDINIVRCSQLRWGVVLACIKRSRLLTVA